MMRLILPRDCYIQSSRGRGVSRGAALAWGGVCPLVCDRCPPPAHCKVSLQRLQGVRGLISRGRRIIQITPCPDLKIPGREEGYLYPDTAAPKPLHCLIPGNCVTPSRAPTSSVTGEDRAPTRRSYLSF